MKNKSYELFTVKFRHKDPEGSKSKLITKNVKDTEINFDAASTDFKFAAAVALYGMQLTDSEFIEDFDTKAIFKLAEEVEEKTRKATVRNL